MLKMILTLITLFSSQVPAINQISHLQAESNYQLGRHFLVGYDDLYVLKAQIKNGTIGGVFITTKNIKGKTKDQIRAEIKELQDLASESGLPPLQIATDQEGGMVERLSPPLSKLPPLSTLIDQSGCREAPGSCFTNAERDSVRVYATTQAKELKDLGITLNFAPVLDVYQGVQVKNDRFTHLHSRSLSQYPWLVTEIGTIYAETFDQVGVTSTLKHFPGLGSSKSDTHLKSEILDKELGDFAVQDWSPFYQIAKNSHAAIMLGHVTLSAIDPTTPASFSRPVIHDLIRQNWDHTGLLITDDFGMYPVISYPGGIGAASIKALEAGVDFILITDPTLHDVAYKAVLQSKLLPL